MIALKPGQLLAFIQIFNESCLYSFSGLGLKLFRRSMICFFVDWATRFVALCDNLTSKVVVHMFDKPFRDLGEVQMMNVNSGTPSHLAFFSASNSL